MSKIGVIDVGGGCRGAYAAGVFDYFMDNNITFDLGIGVSAGSANLASFIAKQPQRNYQFYTKYALRPEYMGMGNFINKKSFVGLDYIYGTLSNSDGENPLDYNTLLENPMDFLVVACEAKTGEPKYFDKNDLAQDNYDIFKASSSIPYVCPPYMIYDEPYYDGALADPVPLDKAFEMGCDKIVLILTLPVDTERSAKQDKILANRIRKNYPLAADKLEHRAELYNSCIAQARNYQRDGKLLIISPDDTCGVSTLSRNKDNLISLYRKGYKNGEKIHFFL